jgi:hypothetical protein
MGDIIDTSFVVPYPTADVYGIGVAGHSVPEASPATPPERTEAQGATSGAQGAGSAPSSGPSETIEGLGRYVDVRV